MPFIGNQPAEAYSSFQKQDFTTSATTSYTLDHPVANGNEIALFINFVRQEPTAAYTASGTSLTLTSATTSSDDMYCVFLGKAVQTVNPPSGSVGAAQLNYPLTTFSSTGIDDNGDQTVITIDNQERVGIRETSPISELHITDSTGTAVVRLESSDSGDCRLNFDDQSGTDRGRIIYAHSDDSLRTEVAGSERMRITSGGQIWMRTTSTSLTNATQVVFHPGSSEYGIRINSTGTSGTQYHQSFDRGQTQAGYITSNSATTIAFNNASDQRLKENIQNSGSAIQDIKDIQVRQFDWIDAIDTHRDFGFVAQELINVVPEAVTQGTDELDENGKPVRSWGVDYSHIVPRLVKVCQEQQTKIEELEARISTLENA